jgi:phosphohistidine phosphatase
MVSRELFLLRHGKSSWKNDASADFDRPLNKRGRHDAERVGHWFLEQQISLDWVLSSPARRAKETILGVFKALGADKDQITWEPRIYEADLATLVEILAGCPESARTVLLVGHNPGLESLLQFLCGADPSLPTASKLLPTAAVARISMPRVWHPLPEGTARLVSLTLPRSLPKR